MPPLLNFQRIFGHYMLSAIARQDLKQLFVLTLPILITQICQSGARLGRYLTPSKISAPSDLSGVAIGRNYLDAHVFAGG